MVAMPWVLEAQDGEMHGASRAWTHLFVLSRTAAFPRKGLHLVITVIGKWKGCTILLPFLLIFYLSRTMCHPDVPSDHRWFTGGNIY